MDGNVPKVWSPSLVAAEQTRLSLRRFIKDSWHTVEPAKFQPNWHLDCLADHLTYVTLGQIRFLLLNMPPRTSKSLVTSVVYPVWDWLQDPTVQFLTASYALQLSGRDALKSRRMIESKWFQERWGHRFSFAFDERLKRQYSNDKGGRRVAIATESATTGEGGNRLVVDDPHNATDTESETKRKGTQDWWDHAMSTRLNQPDKDAWIVNGQRTGQDDLFGHIMRTTDMRNVVHLMLPNEYEKKRACVTVLPITGKVLFRDPRTKEGQLLVPARLGADATARLKRTMKEKYKLQYQQDEKGGGGRILRREAWRKWESEEAPECDKVFTVYDTAFDKGEENDYSARTDWGIFTHRDKKVDPLTGLTGISKPRRHMILIGAWRDKIPYWALRKEARNHYGKIKHDYTLVEKKATGITLCQDLLRGRNPVSGLRKVSVNYGSRVKMDKTERGNIASVVLDDGLVWYMPRAWAEPVIDECAAFPEGNHDDWADTVVNALQFVRRMGEAGWEEEAEDGEVRLFKKTTKRFYG